MANQKARKSAIRARMAETGLSYTGAMRLMDAEDAAKVAAAATAQGAAEVSPLDLQFSSGETTQ